MKERIAIKKRQEAQTEEEKQVELTANSIRNTIAQKMMGPRKRGRHNRNRGPRPMLSIRRTDSSLSAEENMRINAHRNLLMAKHSLQIAQKKVACTLHSVQNLRHAQDRSRLASTKDDSKRGVSQIILSS